MGHQGPDRDLQVPQQGPQVLQGLQPYLQTVKFTANCSTVLTRLTTRSPTSLVETAAPSNSPVAARQPHQVTDQAGCLLNTVWATTEPRMNTNRAGSSRMYLRTIWKFSFC